MPTDPQLKGLYRLSYWLTYIMLMNQVNYTAMSDQELKQHFLRHREDKTALRAYLDRLGDRPCEVITTVDDPDFDTKIQTAILRQMQALDDNGGAGV